MEAKERENKDAEEKITKLLKEQDSLKAEIL